MQQRIVSRGFFIIRGQVTFFLRERDFNLDLRFQKDLLVLRFEADVVGYYQIFFRIRSFRFQSCLVNDYVYVLLFLELFCRIDQVVNVWLVLQLKIKMFKDFNREKMQICVVGSVLWSLLWWTFDVGLCVGLWSDFRNFYREGEVCGEWGVRFYLDISFIQGRRRFVCFFLIVVNRFLVQRIGSFYVSDESLGVFQKRFYGFVQGKSRFFLLFQISFFGDTYLSF